jgi:hypothetical protein
VVETGYWLVHHRRTTWRQYYSTCSHVLLLAVSDTMKKDWKCKTPKFGYFESTKWTGVYNWRVKTIGQREISWKRVTYYLLRTLLLSSLRHHNTREIDTTPCTIIMPDSDLLCMLEKRTKNHKSKQFMYLQHWIKNLLHKGRESSLKEEHTFTSHPNWSIFDLWQNQRILIVWISWKVNIMSIKEIEFRDLRRGFCTIPCI